MRKTICAMLALLLVLSAGIPTASAAHHGGRHQTCARETKSSSDGNCAETCEFTDADQDGVCDNCENICPNCEEAKDENQDGFCDSCGKCHHYADEDGDGICDHHPQSNGNGTGSKTGKTSHHRRGHKHHH